MDTEKKFYGALWVELWSRRFNYKSEYKEICEAISKESMTVDKLMESEREKITIEYGHFKEKWDEEKNKLDNASIFPKIESEKDQLVTLVY